LTRREFHYSNGTHSFFGIVGLAVFVFGVFGMLAAGNLISTTTPGSGSASLKQPQQDSVSLLCGALLAVSGIYGISVFLIRKGYAIVVDEDGISYLRSDRKLRWTQIVGLRFRPILQRLDIIDSTGSNALTIECQVERFGELVDIIVAQVVQHLRAVPLPRTIATKLSRNDLFIGAMILPFFGFAFHSHSRDQFIAFVAFALSCTVFYLGYRYSQLRYLTVTRDDITLVTGSHARAIPLSELKMAKLRLIVVGEGNRDLTVILILADGATIEARPLACDPFEILRTIETALDLRQQ
jgi:hypothetical protein